MGLGAMEWVWPSSYYTRVFIIGFFGFGGLTYTDSKHILAVSGNILVRQFAQDLHSTRVVGGMGHIGNCWNNAVKERIWQKYYARHA